MMGVVGCGNPARSDDGAGSAVIRALREGAQFAGVQLFDAGTDGMAVMFAARGADRLIVVDASNTGAEPGTIFEVPAEELTQPHQPSLNLHDFRWDHALHAGRQIFRDAFPRDIAVYLIEAGSLDMGLELTPAVTAAVGKVVAKIAASCAAYASGKFEGQHVQ